MKLLLLALAPAAAVAFHSTTPPSPTFCEANPNFNGCTPTGYCVNATQQAQLNTQYCEDIGEGPTCFSWNQQVVTDCSNVPNNLCTWVGDGYCDDATFFNTDYNCAKFNFDEFDCAMIVDCDGNLALANLLGNGVCHDGDMTLPNFDCIDYNYDGGDCSPKNCDGSCIDAYPADDGTCQEDFNCKKFEYSWGYCAPPHICPTDWYDLGRENHRCSSRTGGERFASKRMNPFDACECYDFCQDKAAENGYVLSAFDHYSDKCRCWAGACEDRSLIECKDDGPRADEFAPDGRCPSETYFPHSQKLDCHAGDYQQDVTPYSGYFHEHHYDDGYCDNAQFGVIDYAMFPFGSAPIGDYSCDNHDFNSDADDCDDATCDEIWLTTQFAVLDDANMVCDGHDNEIFKETAWTTACDCYEFCAPTAETDEVLFQRNNHGQCQCLTHCDSQSNCGIESECQIFSAERVFDCCGDDWTLGKVVTEIDPGTLGDFYTHRVASLQETQQQNKVISYEYLSLISDIQGYCVPEFMCVEHAYSFGEVDINGDIVASPCFDCLVQTQDQLNSYTINDTRCDMASNDGIRYMQLTDFYALGSGRSPNVLADYCECEVACRLAKFEFYATGTCPAVSGMAGYDAWAADPSTAFAVDAYKGDCRCWDYCTEDTVWLCTAGVVDRCTEPVAVLLWSDPGQQIVLPPSRPNGGTD